VQAQPEFCYNPRVKARKKKPEKRIFDSIRKPTAPASKNMGDKAREVKRDPVRRKAKHKKADRNDADL
jgi:hypothetical protein